MEREPKEDSHSEKREKLELIRSACIEFKGRRYEAETHTRALQMVYDENPDVLHQGTSFAHRVGFLTTKGRFVDRFEAKEVARDAGQLTVTGMRSTDPQLTSADVRFDMAN